jgi:lipopolysaccharide transport system ATP-binding protein
MSNIVLKAENISKQYRLGQLGTGTISHDLNRAWAKMRGKEDPYLKVGDANDRSKAGGSDYVWSLKDINFEVKQGEVLGIIGKNGAGKSTLLKILSQVTTPTTGQVKVKGRIAALLEVGTGFHPDLSGRENIFLNGAILGMSKQEIKSKLEEIVDFSGVAKYLDTPVKRYSSGMMVRLGFAVAAHLEPEILIVDEVLAVGDAEFQKKCLGKMKSVAGEGRTVLFVSHNMAAIRGLCNSAILLQHGSIKKRGSIDLVMNEYFGEYSKSKGLFTKPLELNKVVCLSQIMVTDIDGVCLVTHNFGNKIVIEIEYRINNRINGLMVWFAIRTLDDQIVFASTDNDLDPEILSYREPGYYAAKCIIPEGLLNTGNYRLVVGLNRVTGFNETFERIDDLVISVEDTNHYHSNEISERTGVIKPFLNWELIKKNA